MKDVRRDMQRRLPIGECGLSAMKRRVRRVSLLTSRRPTGGKRDFGQAAGLRLSRFCWRSFSRRYGEVRHSYPRNSGTGFGIKGVRKDYLKDRLWRPLDGGIGSIAIKRRAGRVSLSMSRHPTGDKQGFRIADDLTKRLFEPNGLGASLSSPTAPCPVADA